MTVSVIMSDFWEKAYQLTNMFWEVKFSDEMAGRFTNYPGS